MENYRRRRLLYPSEVAEPGHALRQSTGKDTLATRRGMDINATQYMAVVDNTMEASGSHGVGEREKQ